MTLAIINVWRSSTVKWTIAKAWKDAFPHSAALKVVKSAPKRPIKGRWGIKRRLEALLIKATRDELAFVFHKLLEDDDFLDEEANPPANAADELDFEDDHEAFRAKRGKYAREALTGQGGRTGCDGVTGRRTDRI